VKNIWGNILYSAVSEEPYVMNVLEQAKNNFKTSAMKGMGGVPEDWYLVNTRPVNWYDLIKDKSSLIRIEIDISNQEYPLFWNIDNSRQVRLDPSTALKKVYADVLVVNFLRSWLNFEVFQLNWEIKGVDQGYYSSGNLEENEGVFPLLTQSMLVGSLVTIEGEFGPRDLDFLSDQKTTRKLSLGPFSLEAENNKPEIRLEKNLASVSSSVTQIIGYISRLVPRCPD
jgi:hypothetical protein